MMKLKRPVRIRLKERKIMSAIIIGGKKKPQQSTRFVRVT